MCTVDRIVGTIVFVKIEGVGEGSITFSEIAPGRIRNIRDYVVPKKRIVCKVLRISGDRIDLSFRRVTQKEQKEIKKLEKLEKSYKSIIKGVLKDKAEFIINEISNKEKLNDFIQEAKEDSKKLEKLVGKENSKKIIEIILSQKSKNIIVKKNIDLTTSAPDGILLIKEILEKIKEAEIKYLHAGKYTLKIESEDPKTADHKLKEIILSIEKQAKEKNIEFSIN